MTEFYQDDETLGRVPKYSSLSWNRVRVVKHSKVNDTCYYCKKPIKKGDPAYYVKGLDEFTGFYYFRTCRECGKW